MSPVTALILTCNEEPNIGRTLEVLGWVNKVIVLDSFSADRTKEIAALFPNVVVYQREFDTHATQWNYGLDLVDAEWVLTLDADYVIPPGLADEIRQVTTDNEIIGYSAEFRYLIFGRPLRGSIYPPRVVLFRTKHGRYVDEGHTQQLRLITVEEGKLPASPTGVVRPLAAKIYHDDRKPLSRWIQSQDSYAMLEACYLVKGGRKKAEGGKKGEGRYQKSEVRDLSFQDKLRKMIVIAPIVMPIYLLFGRGLILDGWRGWYYVFQRTVAELMLSLRLLERKLKE